MGYLSRGSQSVLFLEDGDEGILGIIRGSEAKPGMLFCRGCGCHRRSSVLAAKSQCTTEQTRDQLPLRDASALILRPWNRVVQLASREKCFVTDRID